VNPNKKPRAPWPFDALGRARAGYRTLQGRVKIHGLSVTDKRSPVGRRLRADLAAMVSSLGGPEHVTPAQRITLELLTRQRFLLEHIDAFMFSQPSLINLRSRVLYPITLQRQKIVDGILRLLSQLDLKFMPGPAPVLEIVYGEREHVAEIGPGEGGAQATPPAATEVH
jgi:hypothetical protein